MTRDGAIGIRRFERRAKNLESVSFAHTNPALIFMKAMWDRLGRLAGMDAGPTHHSKKRQREDAGDGRTRVVVDHLHAEIGTAVTLAPCLKQFTKLLRISRQRTMRLSGDAPLDMREFAIEPDRHSVIRN